MPITAVMMGRVILVAVLIFAGMFAVKDGRALQRAGVLSSCQVVRAPAGDDAHWEACRPGRLEGRPDLRRRSCTSAGLMGEREFWRCPANVATGFGT